jgi:hypothetical protein
MNYKLPAHPGVSTFTRPQRPHTRQHITHARAGAASILWAQPSVGVQRLEVLIAVMLARSRPAAADGAAYGHAPLAAALATLPSGVLEMVAKSVAALGCASASATEP